jgi:hypothetical protein
MTNVRNNKASEEQMAYAGVLNIGMWLGLAVLVITFFVYLSGILPSYVPIDDLPKYWTLKVHDYNVKLNAPTGWGWAALVGKGDYLNFIGIAMLSGLTILCYLVILPILLRKKDMAYFIIAIVEVLVLSLAASGLLKVGGH